MPRRYDAAFFIVPGSDAQGHHERVYCQVPPGMMRQVQVIIASRKFPFRTAGDIYRWAIWEGLQMLERLEPMPNTYLSRVAAANDIIRQNIYLEEFQATIEEMDRTVARLMAMGGNSIGQAQKLVAQVRSQFAKIDEEYYRTKLVAEVDRRFGHLMGAGRKATVIGGKEGDAE